MRLSSKGEYGLLALVDLALHVSGEPTQASEVAERQDIPKQYLDQLLVSLKRAGLVTSLRGRQGGYQLARPADKITLLDAVRALEGPVANQNFLAKAGRRKNACHAALRSVWQELTKQTICALRDKTLQDIAAECKSVEETAMYYI